MRIRTSYDCEIEPKDVMNLQHGHALTATLSDGTVAFTFHMAPELVQANGTRRTEPRALPPPPLLTDGGNTKKKSKSTSGWGKRGVCPHCGAGPILLAPHIHKKHHGKATNPTGKFKCPQCVQRYDDKTGLITHVRYAHPKP